MILNFRHIAPKVIVYLMIAIIGLLITNQAVYLHMHKMADGRVIHHAHPYQKSDNSTPFANHHHSLAEIIFFENLTIFIPLVLFFLSIILITANSEFKEQRQENHLSTYLVYSHNRAPPV